MDRELMSNEENYCFDVLMFMGGAQTHGAYPWRSERSRRAVLINYLSRSIVL